MTQRVQGKQRTFADVRKTNGTEAMEKAVKKAAKERLAADREAISQALSNPTEKSVKENLLDLKQRLDRSGTSKQRKEFTKIFKGELKSDKEMLDWALSESKNSGDLLSIEKEVKAFGSKAQKEQWKSLYEKYNPIKQQSNYSTDKAVEKVRQQLSGGSDYKAASEALAPKANNTNRNELQKMYEHLFGSGEQVRTAQSDAAVARVKQQLSGGSDYKAASEAIAPKKENIFTRLAKHNKKQRELKEAFANAPQQKTPQSEAAVERVRQQLSGGSDYRAASEALVQEDNNAIRKFMEHQQKQQMYDDLFGAVKDGGQATKPQQSLQGIMDDLANRRNSWINPDPAKDLARQVAKPSIPSEFIPPVKPELTPEKLGEIYGEGLKDGLRKGKKVINHNTTNFNTFITEINDNVSTNIQKELGKFEKTQQTFLNGIDSKLTQFGENQAQTLGKFEDLATRMDGTLTKMEGAAGKIGKSASRISKAANTIEGAATTIENAANTIDGAATSIGQSATRIGNAANTIEGAAKSIGQSAANIGQSATKIGDAAAKMDGLTGRLEQALEAGQKAQSTLKNLKWAAIGAGVVLGALALFKACSGDSKKAAVTPEPEKTQGNEVVTIIDKGNKNGKPVVPTKPEVQEQPVEYWFNRDAIKGFDIPKLGEVPELDFPDLNKYFPEEKANGDDIINGNLDGKKVYIAKKGDSVWKIAKKILAKSPELKKSIKDSLTNKSDDAVIQVLTMAICKVQAPEIDYYANKQVLPKIGDKVQIPEKYLEEIKEALKDKSLNEVVDKAA